MKTEPEIVTTTTSETEMGSMSTNDQSNPAQLCRVIHSVSNGYNPLELFRVRVGTERELWQPFCHMKEPDRWHVCRFPPQNPACARQDVTLQLSN